MKEHLLTAVQALEERFHLDAYEFRGEMNLIVPPDKIEAACQALLEEFGFERLSAITAVDYFPQADPRYHIVYQLHSIQNNVRLGLRVPVPAQVPSVPTIEGVYPNANWHEREIWDMFGVRFEGHSDLRRILMPADWEGHPLRKDYPLGYEEVQFTFNVDEVQQRKPKPSD